MRIRGTIERKRKIIPPHLRTRRGMGRADGSGFRPKNGGAKAFGMLDGLRPYDADADEFRPRMSTGNGKEKRKEKRVISFASRLAKRMGSGRFGMRTALLDAAPKRIVDMLSPLQISDAYGRRRGRGLAALYTQAADPQPRYSQRVIVKTHISKQRDVPQAAARLKAHTKYLGRDGAGMDGEPASFYDARKDEVNVNRRIRGWAEDNHHFRMIISAENGADIEDLRDYTRRLMAQAEIDFRVGIEWVAVDHYNTDQPHTHVLLRGRDVNGNELRINPGYISFGMRRRAEDLATEILGERTIDQVRESQKQEMTADRFTSLDRQIAQRITNGSEVALYRTAQERPHSIMPLLRGRMQQLERMGLAEKTGGTAWRLRDDWEKVLTPLGRQGDIIKQMHDALGRDAARTQLYDPGGENARTIAGKLTRVGYTDEITGKQFAVIEDNKGRRHFVPVSGTDRLVGLREGALIEIGPGARTGRADENIAMLAARNDGIYDPQKHLAFVGQRMAFIPPDQRVDYIGSHTTRLASLERAGIVEARSEGRYRIPPDLRERAEALDAKMRSDQAKGNFVRVRVISEIPVAAQKNARAATWLDRELKRIGEGRGESFRHDRETAAALRERAAWLKQEGLAQENGSRVVVPTSTISTLAKREWVARTRAIEAQYDKAVMRLEIGKDIEAKYRGTILMHGGRYAVLDRGNSIVLAKVIRPPEIAVGTHVSATLTSSNGVVQLAVGRGMAR